MTTQAHKMAHGKAHLCGLRINDLVAKVARVTLKDTTRVLMAFDAVVDFLELPTDQILEEDFSVERPIADESEKCALAYLEFEEFLAADGDSRWLQQLRTLD